MVSRRAIEAGEIGVGDNLGPSFSARLQLTKLGATSHPISPNRAANWRKQPRGCCGSAPVESCQTCGTASVPVRIVKLTDAGDIEAQVVENLQREDVHPLEEASVSNRSRNSENAFTRLRISLRLCAAQRRKDKHHHSGFFHSIVLSCCSCLRHRQQLCRFQQSFARRELHYLAGRQFRISKSIEQTNTTLSDLQRKRPIFRHQNSIFR